METTSACGSHVAGRVRQALERDQWERWHRGERVPAEEYIRRLPPQAGTEDGFALAYGEYLVREELGELPETSEYLGRFPQYAARWQEQLELHQALARTSQARSASATPTIPFGSQSAIAATTEHDPQIPGYEVVGELGRGGMGVVYRARQVTLERLVALKLMRSGGYTDDGRRERFRREAEAVARLQHSNVVQIFEVGEHQGQPYLALEFVEGGSLAQRIDGAPQAPRTAALLVAALARAIQHAHEHGIVHRDLKPANVLLTPDGTPKITDFGLARRLDGAVGQTESGAIVGTAAYMAPEQAAGKGHEVGPAADIYALGAILYELLIGRPPFRGETPMDTLLQTIGAEPVPPRRLQPKVPRDLETICLKCLHKEPAKRYVTGQALAEDLGRFLAGEPIRARPTPTWERAWKWARREPKVAVLAVLVMAVTAAAFALVTWQWRRAEEQRQMAESARGEAVELAGAEAEAKRTAEAHAKEATKQRDEAKRQRDKARAHFRLAREAVDKFHTEVSSSPEMKARGVEKLRARLLRTATEFYQQFVKEEEGTEPEVKAERGRTLIRLANLESITGQTREAEELYGKGLTIFQELADHHPDVSLYQDNLVSAYVGRGDLYRATGRSREAEENYRQAILTAQRLATAYPAVPEFQSNLVKLQDSLGRIYRDTGRNKVAEQSFRAALSGAHRLVDGYPNVHEYQRDLGQIYLQLGNLCMGAGRLGEAEKAHRQAQTAFQGFATHHPDALDGQVGLADSQGNLGNVYRLSGRVKEAEKAYQQALATFQKLADDHPAIPLFTARLGGIYVSLGVLHDVAGRPGEAIEPYGKAVTRLSAVLEMEPQHPEVRQFLRDAHQGRAIAQMKIGRNTDAARDWQRAIELDTGSKRVSFQWQLALTLGRSGDHAGALNEARQLESSQPSTGDSCYGLAALYSLASGAVAKDHRIAEAQRTYLAEQYAHRAVDFLQKARAAGIFRRADNLAHLKKDPDLDTLRERADFKKLLADLE